MPIGIGVRWTDFMAIYRLLITILHFLRLFWGLETMGKITWLANVRPLDSETDWSQLASHKFFSSHLTGLYINSLYCELLWHFPGFQKFFVAALISSHNNLDPSASFCCNRKAKKRRKTKKANFTSFSWLGKKRDAQIEQHSKISKSLCELGKTCNYSLWPNLESMVGLWKFTS